MHHADQSDAKIIFASDDIMFKNIWVREPAKKVIFFRGPTTKRGGGKGPATRGKKLFFSYLYILAQKMWKFFLSKSVSGYFKTKKK